MQIIGRKFTHAEFKAYLDGINVGSWAKFVVVHNTSAPDIRLYRDDWMNRPPSKWSPEQWLRNLASFYAAQGWKGAPHLFIPPTPDQILVLNDLRVHGTHTPSWNGFSIGVETVGEFERETFAGTPSQDNLVAALAMLHHRFGFDPADYQLGVKGLHFHKEDNNTTHKTCPGRNMVKEALVRDVVAEMTAPAEPDHPDVPLAAQEAETSAMSIEELTSVRWLQTMLNRWDKSLGLTVDGMLGTTRSYTRGAVRKFQSALHLRVDGIPGPVTRKALKNAAK